MESRICESCGGPGQVWQMGPSWRVVICLECLRTHAPLSLRLEELEQHPERRWRKKDKNSLRFHLLAKQEGRCAYCGAPFTGVILPTLDHVVPRSRGGAKLGIENLVLACRSCNVRKGNRSADHFLFELHGSYDWPTFV